MTAADVRLYVISRDEALRLVADDARAVPEAEKGAPLGALDVFDAGALCEGSCLLVELSGPSDLDISNAIAEAPSAACGEVTESLHTS